MARSRKKTPGYYVVKSANKPRVRKKEKVEYNKKWRRLNKLRVKKNPELLIDKHDKIANKWDMIQDGNYHIVNDKQFSRK